MRLERVRPVLSGSAIVAVVAIVAGWHSLVALEWSGMPSTNGGATAGQIEVTNVNDPALDVLPPD
jgi:hypothetical protein